MTSIEQLQISGIRSFDPSPSNRQVIAFQKPLTVILGKNGAGKTTIIEALLNACTGAMPPGSGTEKSAFVYDPKVIGESEVKAQLRLIFTGKGGKVMQVIRSFQTTYNRGRATFTTLDNTLAYQDTATGKVVSQTYRASDVDRVVPEMLGVSAAVLEHVIFCHQEDCNWPLAPPKDVKRIFDDIFAATRYVLALDRLRENSKDLRRQQKEHEASLMALREHRDHAITLEEDIARKEELIKSIQGHNASIEPQLLDLKKASASLDGAEQSIDALAREAALIQGRMDEKREAIRRVGVQTPSHTLEQALELQQDLSMQQRQREQEVAQKARQLEETQKHLRAQEEQLHCTRSKLQALEWDDQQYGRDRAELLEILHGIADEFAIARDGVDERNVAEAVARVGERLQKVLADRQAALQGLDDRLSVADKERYAFLRDMNAEVKEREMIHATMEELSSQITKTQASLRELGGEGCHHQLRQLKEEVQQWEQRLQAAEELRKNGEHYQDQQRLLKEFEEQNAVVARLRRKMALEKQRSGGKAEVAALRRQLKERRDALADAIQTDVHPKLVLMHIEVSHENSFSSIVSAVERVQRQAKEHLSSVQKQVTALDCEAAAMERERSSLTELLVRREAELSQKESQCAAVLGSVDLIDQYERRLQEARLVVEDVHQRRHAMDAIARCHRDFVEIANKSNMCVVCERPFENHNALERFIEVHNVRQQSSPQAIKDMQLELLRAQDHLHRLESIQHAVGDVRQLRTLSLLQTKESLKELEGQLETHASRHADATTRLEELEQEVDQFHNLGLILASLRTIDSEIESLHGQLVRREKQLEESMQQDPESSSSPDITKTSEKTYEELAEEYEGAIEELHRLNKQLNAAQWLESGSSFTDIERELLEKRTALYQLEIVVDKVKDQAAALQHYTGEQEKYRNRLSVINTRRAELQYSLELAEKNLEQIRRQRAEVERTESIKVENAQRHVQMLESITPKVMNYIKSEHTKRLHAAREHLHEVESVFRQREVEVNKLSAELGEASRMVEECNRRTLELNRIVDVLELQKSLESEAERLAEIEASLVEFKGNHVQVVDKLLGDLAKTESLPRLREIIRAKISELEKVLAQHEGSMAAILHDISSLRAQLAREKYQNIEKRYRSTFLKVQTTEMAVKDIEKYYGALEKAVQSYHQEKIAQINQIISDLWRQTYRGSDIDTIEIQSESETTSTVSGRRSYNYRVVMKRGNSEIDMRGRCSAGQKVLASVIIRLAVSEAFCYECGILALDEPTTNLDEDNARSLAAALQSLIKMRRAIKHFQLIVITHDEQFVRALGAQTLDRFYYVHKDQEGVFSIIEERTFDQLFA